MHLNFNPKNRRYKNAHDMIDTVRVKYKTAFITACVELYQQHHPYGVDYKELDAIVKETWAGVFLPRFPIKENLQNRGTPALPPTHSAHTETPQGYRPAAPPPSPVERPGDDAVGNAMDQTLGFYDDDPDED